MYPHHLEQCLQVSNSSAYTFLIIEWISLMAIKGLVTDRTVKSATDPNITSVNE